MTRALPMPDLADDAHKGDAGRVLCFCGSRDMPGAAILAVRAAQRAGAGLVTLACFSDNLMQLLPLAAPEAVLLDFSASQDLITGRLPAAVRERADHARLAGCGLGASEPTRALVKALLRDPFEGPLVLDADALNVLGTDLESVAAARGPVVLTPHPGEAGRLLGRSVPRDDEGRVACARELSDRASALCVLKGPRSVVCRGDRVFVNESGNSGMATAGSGDVLAGMLAAYAAWFVASAPDDRDLFDVCVSAVHLHGLAGDLAALDTGRRGLIASDLIDALPAAQEASRTGA